MKAFPKQSCGGGTNEAGTIITIQAAVGVKWAVRHGILEGVVLLAESLEMNSKTDQLRDFVQRWKTAGPVLEEIARCELQAMSDEERRKTINALLQVGERFPAKKSTPETCGLIEQQRLFGLLRR